MSSRGCADWFGENNVSLCTTTGKRPQSAPGIGRRKCLSRTKLPVRVHEAPSLLPRCGEMSRLARKKFHWLPLRVADRMLAALRLGRDKYLSHLKEPLRIPSSRSLFCRRRTWRASLKILTVRAESRFVQTSLDHKYREKGPGPIVMHTFSLAPRRRLF